MRAQNLMSTLDNPAVETHFNEMRCIENLFIQFIEIEENLEEADFEIKQYNYFANLPPEDKKLKLKEILYLISQIGDNHYQTTNFYAKIERLINLFTTEIKQSMSNDEIFDYFRENCRIILFLFTTEIITMDRYIANWLIQSPFKRFFSREILTFVKGSQVTADELIEEEEANSSLKRQIGMNDSYICQLIRDDSVEEFIKYVTQANMNLSSLIPFSKYESSPFLIDDKYREMPQIDLMKPYQSKASLIEYAAFYGSLKIFKYLRIKDVNFSPSIWLYAIHSNNPDIIHILEEDEINPPDGNYEKCFIEALKCHHIKVAKYLLNEYITMDSKIAQQVVKYHNYEIFNEKFIDHFFDFAQFDYPLTVKILLNTETSYDINSKIKVNDVLFNEF